VVSARSQFSWLGFVSSSVLQLGQVGAVENVYIMQNIRLSLKRKEEEWGAGPERMGRNEFVVRLNLPQRIMCKHSYLYLFSCNLQPYNVGCFPLGECFASPDVCNHHFYIYSTGTNVSCDVNAGQEVVHYMAHG